MSMLTTSFVSALLAHYFQNANHANVGDATGLVKSTVDGSIYVALHTADPGDAGSQNTSEIAYTGYARAPTSRTGAAGWTVASKNVSPTVELSFGKRTDAGASTSAFFFSIGSASSGAGVLYARGGIGPAPQPFTAATTDTITSYAHGLAVDDRVVFWQYEPGSLPTGITEGTVYWVKTAPDANTFTVSTTQGGATLDITAVGQGTCQKITPIAVTQNVTPKIETGTTIKFQ
jgi:hypothetical protein